MIHHIYLSRCRSHKDWRFKWSRGRRNPAFYGERCWATIQSPFRRHKCKHRSNL